MDWFTSDLHFGHDREFIYKPRGFDNIIDHNETLIKNINEDVAEDDNLYIIGDIMLGDNSLGLEYLCRINCKNIYIITGNHDTDTRKELYKNCSNVKSVELAMLYKYKKYHALLLHWHADTANLDDKSITQCLLNFYGHTHQKTNFWMDTPMYYHVGVDSHKNHPVNIEQIISDINNKVDECKKFL